MGRTVFKQIAAGLCTFLLCCLFIVEGSGSGKAHHSVTIHSREQVSLLLQERVPGHVNINPLVPGAFPRTGTVSHHLLVSPLINAWFRDLKNHRQEVGTFIIISPNHRRLGKSPVSLSLRDWMSAGLLTAVDRDLARSIMQSLDLKEDDLAFYGEHGIEALLPFVARYFPRARIVPILVDEQRRSGALNARLRESLVRVMRSRRDAFLLISTDFSHGQGRKETDLSDARSLRSLMSLGRDRVRPVSDNTAGLEALYQVCHVLGVGNSHLFCHTDAEKVTGEDQGDNITSYMFTFQY